MTLYRITIAHTPPRCRSARWIKGFVLAENEKQAWDLFVANVGETRVGKSGVRRIEVIKENEVYIYRHDF